MTISGDNSNSAGYLPGETVVVNVQGPNGYEASCEATVADDGTWSCQITLWNDDRAVGEYQFTANGALSETSESGTFTDGPVNVRFATTGLPAGTNVSLPWSGTNPGGNPVSATLLFTAPGPAGTQAFLHQTTANCTFPASIVVSGNTYNLITTPCPLNSGAEASPTPTRIFTATYQLAAPTNTAPTINWTTNPSAAIEGDIKTFTFSMTDAAADTHTFAAGCPDCGTANTVSNALIDDTTNTGTFDCTFVDGLVPAVASTVKVKVKDQGNLESSELTQNVTVSNANRVVAKPMFLSTLIACNTSVDLTGLSFSDAGLYDDPWSMNIAWGDGEDTPVPGILTQGAQEEDQDHTYTTPGTFTATVQVTDKDTGAGTNTSSNTVQVYQYVVDFLPPFDDSSPSGLIVNRMKNGRVVPVKARILDLCTGSYLTDPGADVTITMTKTAGGGVGDPVEEYADAGQSSAGTDHFRQTEDFWIYNLDSKALGLIINNTYRVDVYVDGAKATITNWAVLQPVK